MDCNTVKETLGRFIDHEIDETTAAAITAHLDSCESCRTERNRLSALDSFFSESDPIVVPASFRDRVMARAQTHMSVNQNSIAEILGDLIGWWRRAGSGLRLATATTALCGLAIGLVLTNNLTPDLRTGAATPLTSVENAYSLDFLGDSPHGSLTEVYLTFVEEREGEGK